MSMRQHVDLRPAAQRLADLVAAVPADRIHDPTPCPEYCVGDLLDHIGGLALAFTAAASKAGGALGSRAPSGDVAELGRDWRTRIPEDLRRLAEAWDTDDAWTGMTQAGGVDLPGDIAGAVALNELVVHGWDLAVATGQPYECDADSLDVSRTLLAAGSADADAAGGADAAEGADAVEGADGGADEGSLFGPAVPVADTAPPLDQIIGLSGRDPEWSPPLARTTHRTPTG
jgi:uncharacterized protein (TIGR03086 family)